MPQTTELQPISRSVAEKTAPSFVDIFGFDLPDWNPNARTDLESLLEDATNNERHGYYGNTLHDLDPASQQLVLSYVVSTRSVSSESILFSKRLLKAAYFILNSSDAAMDLLHSEGLLEKLYRFHVQTLRIIDGELSRRVSTGQSSDQYSSLTTRELKRMKFHLHGYAAGIAKRTYERTAQGTQDRLKWANKWYNQAHRSTDMGTEGTFISNRYRQRSEAAAALHAEALSGLYNGTQDNTVSKILGRPWSEIAAGCGAEHLKLQARAGK